jgi:hypothetical protein
MNGIKMIRKMLAAGKEILQCPAKMEANFQEILINQGRMMSPAIQNRNSYRSLADLEFKVLSETLQSFL